jgi:MFS family permease
MSGIAQSSAVPGPAPKQAVPERARALACLEIGYFRIYLAGTLLMLFSLGMQQVAQGQLAYTLGNSAVALGAVTLAMGITMFPLSLVAGAVADRFAKRRLILATQALAAATALAIAALIATGRIAIWHLVIAGLLQGVVMAFNLPARQAIIPEMVGMERFPGAMSLAALVGNMSRIVGPSLAGLLMGSATFGIHGTYFVVSAALCFAAVMALWLPRSPESHSSGRESLTASILSGIQYLRSHPYLLLLTGMAFFAPLLGMSTQALLPVFNEIALSGNVRVLGFLYTAMAVGTLLGSFSTVWIGRPSDTIKLQILFGLGMGVSLALLSFAADYRVALILLSALGFCFQAYMTLNMTAVMSTSAPEYCGRVMSIHQLAAAFPPLATFFLAAAVDAFGIRATFAATGVGMVGAMIAIAVFSGKTRH